MSSTLSETDPETAQWLLYDGECPFCARYVSMVRLRESIGRVRLIDARDQGPELLEVRAAGLNIDEGMVLKLNGRLHHGDECIQHIALLTTPSGVFNRLNAWVFRSGARSRALYPMLRTGRNTALRLLGRAGIETP